MAGGLHDEAGRDDGRLEHGGGGVLQRQLRPERGGIRMLTLVWRC